MFPEHDKSFIKGVSQKAQRFNGEETADHIFRVAASLDSLIIGEREIITQLRNAYEECEKMKLTGDSLRMLNQHAIRIAKDVYTHTNLSKKPVSIVSIAWKLFQEKHSDHNAKIVLVGAGQIITNFAKFLAENEWLNAESIHSAHIAQHSKDDLKKGKVGDKEGFKNEHAREVHEKEDAEESEAHQEIHTPTGTIPFAGHHAWMHLT